MLCPENFCPEDEKILFLAKKIFLKRAVSKGFQRKQTCCCSENAYLEVSKEYLKQSLDNFLFSTFMRPNSPRIPLPLANYIWSK